MIKVKWNMYYPDLPLIKSSVRSRNLSILLKLFKFVILGIIEKLCKSIISGIRLEFFLTW